MTPSHSSNNSQPRNNNVVNNNGIPSIARHIRIFISSTFEDMVDERTFLMEKTFPKLSRIAAQRDVILTEVDLRWGITAEEANNGKVLDICFTEIEKSIPFFIGIIGHKYGSVPTRNMVEAATVEHFPMIGEYLDKNLSYTEMEIQFGVLERDEDMHASFYFKDGCSSTDSDPRLNRLKKAVKSGRYPFYDYSSSEVLSSLIEERFIALLDDLFPLDFSLTGHQKEQQAQNTMVRNLSFVYIPDQMNYSALDAFITSQENQYLVVTGDSGSGKSALLANWYLSKSCSASEVYIPFFISNGGNQLHTYVTEYLAEEVRLHLGLEDSPSDTSLENLLAQIPSDDRKIIFILDAVNQIADYDNAKRMKWLPVAPPNVKFIISTLADDSTMDVFKERNYRTFYLPELPKEGRRRIVSEYVAEFGKTITDERLERIVCCPTAINTLVLKSFTSELIVSGSEASLDELIEYFSKSTSVTDFYLKVISKYEYSFNNDLVRDALSLIAVSSNGIPEDILIRILTRKGHRPLDWAYFSSSFSTHLCNHSGYIIYTHNFITNSVNAKYLLHTAEYESEIRQSLVQELEREELSDYILTELPFQYDKLMAWDKLHEFILRLPVLEYYMKEHERELTLGRYWRHVKEESNNPYLLSDYLEIPIDDKNLVKYYSMLLRLAGVLYDAPASATFSEKLEAFIDRKPEYAGIDAYGALAGSLAGASCSEKQMKKALEYAEMCRSLHKGKGTMSEYESLGTLAGVYYWLGVVTHNDEYDRMFYKAHYDRLPLAERLFGKESGPVINTLSDLALFADNKEDRLSYGLRAVNMAIALFGPNNILVARPHHYLGCVYRDYRIWDEALEHFKIANTIWLKAYGLYHEILNSSFGNVGDSYTGMGLNNEALDCYNKCLSIQKRIFGEKRYEYAIVAYKLAIVFRKLGKGEEVIHWANEAKVTLTKGICKDEQRSKDLLKILMKDFAPYLI